jgi:hypothetical protein
VLRVGTDLVARSQACVRACRGTLIFTLLARPPFVHEVALLRDDTVCEHSMRLPFTDSPLTGPPPQPSNTTSKSRAKTLTLVTVHTRMLHPFPNGCPLFLTGFSAPKAWELCLTAFTFSTDFHYTMSPGPSRRHQYPTVTTQSKSSGVEVSLLS